jgi:hypothetical protein
MKMMQMEFPPCLVDQESWDLMVKEEGGKIMHVNVYEMDRVCGGQEEGGWWFDVGTAIASIMADTLAEARDAYIKMWNKFVDDAPCAYCDLPRTYHLEDSEEDSCDQYRKPNIGSVVYRGGEYYISVESHIAEDFPKERPRYE